MFLNQIEFRKFMYRVYDFYVPAAQPILCLWPSKKQTDYSTENANLASVNIYENI